MTSKLTEEVLKAVLTQSVTGDVSTRVEGYGHEENRNSVGPTSWFTLDGEGLRATGDLAVTNPLNDGMWIMDLEYVDFGSVHDERIQAYFQAVSTALASIHDTHGVIRIHEKRMGPKIYGGFVRTQEQGRIRWDSPKDNVSELPGERYA